MKLKVVIENINIINMNCAEDAHGAVETIADVTKGWGRDSWLEIRRNPTPPSNYQSKRIDTKKWKLNDNLKNLVSLYKISLCNC